MQSELGFQIFKVKFRCACNKYHFWAIDKIDTPKISNDFIARKDSIRRGRLRRLLDQLWWSIYTEKLLTPLSELFLFLRTWLKEAGWKSFSRPVLQSLWFYSKEKISKVLSNESLEKFRDFFKHDPVMTGFCII